MRIAVVVQMTKAVSGLGCRRESVVRDGPVPPAPPAHRLGHTGGDEATKTPRR
jgi:hypothetical protein